MPKNIHRCSVAKTRSNSSGVNKKASIRWQHSRPPRASNGGRSLWVQISRERSYPLPIYWYHSKGNWLRYNIAADSFI